MAAISRSDLKKAFAKSYSTPDYWKTDPHYATILNDLAPYNNPNYIIAFTAYSNFAQNAPPDSFVRFLENCGAGEGLESWLDTKKSNAGIYSCCALAHSNYVFAGIPGSGRGKGYDNFQRAGSCDTSDNHWGYLDYWLDKPAPMASLMVDLYQVQGATDSQLVLEIGKARAV